MCSSYRLTTVDGIVLYHTSNRQQDKGVKKGIDLMQKVNLAEAFGRFDDRWSPKIIGEVNDCQVKLAKVQGEFVWHRHETEDELFMVIKGRRRGTDDRPAGCRTPAGGR